MDQNKNKVKHVVIFRRTNTKCGVLPLADHKVKGFFF